MSDGIFVSVKMLTKEKQEHINLIKSMAEKGEIKAYIDKSFNLTEMVVAHRYVDTGRKRGNVVIDVLNA